MLIGISNYPFTDKWKSLKSLKMLGFDAIDYSIANTDSFLYNSSFDELRKYLSELKAELEETGLFVSQTHGPWMGTNNDNTEEKRTKTLGDMKRCILITELLDCKYMVIHPLMPFGTKDKKIARVHETRDINLNFMRTLIEFAKEHNVTLCLENMPMPEFSLGSPAEIFDLVREINDEHFKICLDVGHVATYEDLNLGDSVRLLGNYIKVLHVHDSIKGLDLHTVPYLGKTDWVDFAKALNDVDYDGVFSLEISPPTSLSVDARGEFFKLLNKISREIVNQ